MDIPSKKHPKIIKIDGYMFQVVTYYQLTDGQASKLAMRFYQTHKLKKKDQGKVFHVAYHGDQDSLGLL